MRTKKTPSVLKIAQTEKILDAVYARHSVDKHAKTTELTQEDWATEYVMMTLRLKEGMSLLDFAEKFGYDLYEAHKKKLDLYIQNDLMVCKDGRIAFTKKGIQVSNSIVCELI